VIQQARRSCWKLLWPRRFCTASDDLLQGVTVRRRQVWQGEYLALPMNDQPKTAVTRIAASVHSVLAEQPGMNASDVFLDQDFDPDLFLRAENFAPVLPCAQYHVVLKGRNASVKFDQTLQWAIDGPPRLPVSIGRSNPLCCQLST
jgi:hypothetical protein